MPKRSSTSTTPQAKKKKSTAGTPPAKNKSLTLDDNDPDIMSLDCDDVELDDGPRISETSKLRSAFFETFSEIIESFSNNDHDAALEKSRSLSKIVGEDEPAIVDQFMRDYFLGQVLKLKPDLWKSFLELSIKLAREDVCTPSIIFSLISDLLELSSLKKCQTIFEFVETHLEIWKDPIFLKSGKNAVLRMCNDLLRRLSRAQNTIFCGKILIFLSNYFPFSERSGLNILSEFNAENLTVYKRSDGTDDPDDKMDIVEDKNEILFEGMKLSIPGLDKIVHQTQEEKKNRMKVDYNLYVKFWSLQDFFRNPQQCYDKICWKSFCLYANDVLTTFQSFKLDRVPSSKAIKRRKMREKELKFRKMLAAQMNNQVVDTNSSMSEIPKLSDESLYFAKYLTNRRLLELQMSDPSFRRYFLVQLLIILQYLTVAVKFKSDGHVLTDEQQEYVKKTMDRVYSLLEEIPPGGSRFVKAVKHVLAREQLWNQWKNAGCPAFKKPVPTAIVPEPPRLTDKPQDDKMDIDDDKVAKPSGKSGAKAKKFDDIRLDDVTKPPKKKVRRHIGDIIEDAAAKGTYLMGNPELTRLWNICGDNLEACRQKSRDFTPPIEVFFAEAFKEVDMDPAPIDMKKELAPKKILGNTNFGWRALRLMARKSPYFFQMVGGSPIHPLQNYLEYVLRKILGEKEVPATQAMAVDASQRLPDAKPGGADDTQPNNVIVKNEVEPEHEVDGEVEEDEEIIQEEERNETEEEEEEGEVNEKVRNLTDEETQKLALLLGQNWKKLAGKLRFKPDEIQYMEENCGTKSTALFMLERWQEQEGDDATVADLVYIMEGCGLKEISDKVF